mmetsp:Transcript_19894/g.46939  ORF Transcript_19894/g.46939 Transcript_19894/m.46939 type:complete len:315 (+) Transcript_19894:112-1056(+)
MPLSRRDAKRRIANARSAEDTFSLGLRLYTGEMVPKDFVEATQHFRAAADLGHALAQSMLGRSYSRGEGNDRDDEKAAHWFRLSADQGFAVAQYDLGERLFAGLGVAVNHVEAVRYYRLAADQGVFQAMHNLGTCYSLGQGVQQDYYEGARYYCLAANMGCARAQCVLGHRYLSGQGVLLDVGEAARWWRLSADQGNAGAQLSLGALLVGDFTGDARVPTDLRAGAKLLASAAQCVEPQYAAARLQALEALLRHADKREVVGACCIGCGATHGLKRCEKCGKARFCGMVCMRRMWPTHKRCCKKWAAQRDDAPE